MTIQGLFILLCSSLRLFEQSGVRIHLVLDWLIVMDRDIHCSIVGLEFSATERAQPITYLYLCIVWLLYYLVVAICWLLYGLIAGIDHFGWSWYGLIIGLLSIGPWPRCAVYSKYYPLLNLYCTIWFVTTQKHFNFYFKPANSPALADCLVHFSGDDASQGKIVWAC